MPALPVIALFGPTGVGKTAVALALADRLRAQGEDPVAVSADALQLYAGLPILTGAASAEEQQRLEHRLVGAVPITETFSAGRYAQLAHAEIDALVSEGRRPIVVGGTGLYLRAALAELDLRPPPDLAVRAALARRLADEGAPRLHQELPPEARARIDPGDGIRITRALELIAAGHPPPSGDQLWTTHTRHPTVLAALTMDRERLDERIDARVDAMVAAGAAAEVRRAVQAGASPTARNALGFTHLIDGDIDAMKQATRRYARRQLTWLRKLPGVLALDATDADPDALARAILDACASRSGRP